MAHLFHVLSMEGAAVSRGENFLNVATSVGLSQRNFTRRCSEVHLTRRMKGTTSHVMTQTTRVGNLKTVSKGCVGVPLARRVSIVSEL